MPSIGRTIRALLMELVRRGGRPPVGGGGLHHEQALQHVHPAAKPELACLLRCELDRGRLERRERHVEAEILEHEPLRAVGGLVPVRSEEHTSELQSPCNLVCRLLLEKKKTNYHTAPSTRDPALRAASVLVL